MSLQIRQRASPNHAGPSHQRMPVASRSTLALKRRYLLKLGSRLLIAGSGQRSLGSQPPSAVRVSVIAATAYAAPNMWRLVISIGCLRGLSATIAMMRFDSYHTRKPDGPCLALAHEGTLLQCIKTRLARSDISLERMHSVAVEGIGDIAFDPTSLIEPRRFGTLRRGRISSSACSTTR